MRSLIFPLGIDYAAAGEDPTQITIWVRLTHTQVCHHAQPGIPAGNRTQIDYLGMRGNADVLALLRRGTF